MSELMLTIHNRHSAACGIPPAVRAEAADLYIDYFENRYGEQWIFRSIARHARRASGAGTPAGTTRTRCVTDGSTR